MRIRTRTLILMFSQSLNQLTTIILGIALARLISQHELGSFRQVFLAYGLISGFLAFQIESSLFYFLPKFGADKSRQLLTQTTVFSLLLATAVGFILFFGSESISKLLNNPELASPLRAFALYPLADRIVRVIPAFMISNDRAILSAVYSLASAILRVGAPVIVFATGGTLETAIWSSVLTMWAVALVSFINMVMLSRTGKWTLEWYLIIDQLKYTWPLWATTLVQTINSQFDRLLISSFFDPATFAIYSCGAIELPVVAIITTTMASSTMPELVKYASMGKTNEALDLWQKGTRKCSLVIFPCFVFFFMIGPELMVLLYGEGYAKAAWPFAIYLLIMPLRIAFYSTLFRAFGYTKPIGVSVALGLATNILVSTSLIWLGRQSILSFIGPSLGAIAGTLTLSAYLLWKLSRFLEVSVSRIMQWRDLGRVLLVCAVCGLVTYAAPLSHLAAVKVIIFRAAIFFILFIASMIFTKSLLRDETELLLTPVRLIARLKSWITFVKD